MRFRQLLSAGSMACLALATGRTALGDLTATFEPPAYAVGSIVGQQGWTGNGSAVDLSPFDVSTSHPASGTQSLMFTAPTLTNADPYNPVLISPATNTGSASTTTTFSFYIPSLGAGVTRGSTPSVYLVSDASTDVDPKYGLNDYVAGVGFSYNGDISVEEYTPDFGGYMALTDTGVPWTPDTYQTMSISVNSTTGDLKYFYNGSLLADTLADYETTVGNVVVFDSLGPTPGEVINYDNLTVTSAPEPAAIGLLGLAGLGVMRRRSQKRTVLLSPEVVK